MDPMGCAAPYPHITSIQFWRLKDPPFHKNTKGPGDGAFCVQRNASALLVGGPVLDHLHHLEEFGNLLRFDEEELRDIRRQEELATVTHSPSGNPCINTYNAHQKRANTEDKIAKFGNCNDCESQRSEGENETGNGSKKEITPHGHNAHVGLAG